MIKNGLCNHTFFCKDKIACELFKSNSVYIINNRYLCANMGRIIAIDYGKKRTGIAVSDPLKLIAGGLTALPSREVVDFLKHYASENTVDLFLLGDPRQMNYEPSENRERVLKFRKNLQQTFPSIEIRMIDERFTSVLAHQAMIQGGLKKKARQNKELVDELSATILLQSFLETNRI